MAMNYGPTSSDGFGRSMGPSSLPWPLWPLLRQGMRKRETPVASRSEDSPNLEKKPRLRACYGCLSSRPTSSKLSSGVGDGATDLGAR